MARNVMKRFFDLVMAIVALFFLIAPVFVIGLMVKLTSKGPMLYWSDRVGINNNLFKMPKFRTMCINTPVIATHLMADPKAYLTPVGFFLRKFSLDELPQLFSVLKGDISFVGPRPALFNQSDLIHLRTSKQIHRIIPGITGWAQINGRDELPIQTKVELDEYYLKNRSLFLDLRILIATFIKVVKAENVTH